MGIVTDNLSLYLEAALASGGVGPGLNIPFTTTFKDLTGLGHDGTLTNFAGTPASGYAGSGTTADPYRLVFAPNSYVAVPALHACDDKVFTYEAWFMRSGAPSATGYIIAEYSGSTYYPAANIGIDATTGTPSFRTRTDVPITTITGPASVCDGAPHHIVGTADGTYARLYVDGVLVAGPTALPSGALGPTGWTTLGALRYGTTPSFAYYLSGGLAVARIYDRTLSAAEVAANRAAGYVLAPRGGGRFPLLSKGMRI